MEAENSDQIERSAKSKDPSGLRPSKITQAYARVAAENGEVLAKKLENGILVPLTTRENPERVSTTYNSEVENSRAVFLRIASEMQEKIVKRRNLIKRVD